MYKTVTKFILLSVIFAAFGVVPVLAQTITIGTVDPGPYGPGSTIAVPFHVNDASGCINSNNTYQLFMSDASGSFAASTTPVASVSGFYATFINYTIPTTSPPPAGTGYLFMIKSTSPVVSSAASTSFTINATAGLAAAASSTAVNSTYPEVYGQCSSPASSYIFTNNTDPNSGATAVTASFFNESTQAYIVSNHDITSTSYTFPSAQTNYTVIARAVNGAGVVGTYAYQLVNNPVNTSIGSQGTQSGCISGSSGTTLTFTIDISSSSGIQYNYPGNIYNVTWGDGSSSNYTLCQLKSSNGNISHNYTQTSCGRTAGSTANAFAVNLVVSSPYCGSTQGPTEYAKVFAAPTDAFIASQTATCTGTMVTFVNHSTPGPDPNAAISSCTDDPNALYTWLVNGNVVKQNVKLSQSFLYTFTASGSYKVTLQAQGSVGSCTAADFSTIICVQDPPRPVFTIPATNPYCISGGSITPVNTSFIDANCNTSNKYVWTVSPSTYTISDVNAAQPQITFTAPGIYTIELGITTASCGTVNAAAQTIVVNGPPVAALSPAFTACGNGQTLTFDGTAGSQTKTTLSGTAQQLPTTYTWTVTGDPNYSFVNGTNANSQYPQILFNDFATYTVTVVHQNNCSVAPPASQQITFVPAPTVSAGNPQTVCQGVAVHLTGVINGSYVSSLWTTSGTGTFSAPTNKITDYTPSQADVAAGSVTLTLAAQTNLAQCSTITSNVVITLIPTDVINSTAAQTICSGQAVNYTITATNASSTFTWTAAVTSGAATGYTANGSGNTINDVITNSTPTTTAVITYTIAPVSNGCTGTPFAFTVTIPAVPILTATPANAAICSKQHAGISLTSNIAGTTYTWTVSAPAGVTGANGAATPVTASAITDSLVNNNTTNATVTYTITPYNSNGCQGAAQVVSITVYPLPVTANAGPNASLCDITSYQLQGNSPGAGTGKWTVVSGSGITFADATSPTTTISGLQPSTIYTLQWTITTVGSTCQSTSQVTITTNVPTVGGSTSTAGATTVCEGSNGGQINLTGQVGTVLRWESSGDNGVSFQPIADVTTSYTYLNITQTTIYRAVLQNGACNVATSGQTVIKVNPATPIAKAGADQTYCSVTTITLNGNNPGTFTGMWQQTAGPAVVFADATKYNTAVTGLIPGNVYTFTWTIKAIAPCVDTQSPVTITDNADVVPTFTTNPKSGCGNLSVQFTNTSNNQSGAVFTWNFGDGSALSSTVSPQHIFAQRTDGRDTTYYITLNVVGNCLVHPAYLDSVLVRPAVPIAQILPTSLNGCGTFSLTVQNVSPGNNLTYDFYLYQGSTLIQKITKTDKSDVVFNPITTTIRTTFYVYMIATGYCGNTAESTHVPFTITPAKVTAQMFIQNNVNSGCAPLNLTFFNNSAGGDNFHYNIYDINNKLLAQPVAGTAPLPYTLDSLGTFYVTITASNFCVTDESPKTRIDVYTAPTPDFTSDTTNGCKSAVINFINKTQTNDPNTVPTSLIYDWDFGDGSAHSKAFNPPAHFYHTINTSYTVTLTATNTTSGCTNVIVKQSYINITSPPITKFTAKPDTVTAIPNYSFSFLDESTGGAVSWHWLFSDGQTSIKQNPFITFADTGKYKVTLTTANKSGCDSTISHTVQITGVPGQLYLPNAFIPSSLTQELKIFMPKGSGIKTYHLQVFNNYGQLVWETTKLDSKGAPVEGWDGTFKGTPAQQGVYTWQASATFINGTEWKGNTYKNSLPKRTGSINLIR